MIVVEAVKQFSENLSIFAVTIPETVKNLEGATSFVDFMLSTKGKDLLEKQGLKYIKPAIIQGNAEKMPLSLQNLTEHLP
jgi:molybdate/tungstate transport system substrate-binding protein